MRIRTIKPEFWTSQDIADLPDDIDRLLFIGLWNYADDEGRGRDVPRLIRAALFPLRDEIEPYMVDAMMWGLQDSGLITRYAVFGKTFYCVNAWTDHQRVNRPTPSKYPAVHDGSVRTHDMLSEGSITVDNGELEDSLPEQGTGNREVEQGTGNPALSAAPKNGNRIAASLLAEDSTAQYLISRLDEGWQESMTPARLMLLGNTFTPEIVTDALRNIREAQPVANDHYPYLLSECRRLSAVTA
jgi:hypothetical protein